MMITYALFNRETKEFIGLVPASLDPLETELAGHEVYLVPPNATEVLPGDIPAKHKARWTGTAWEILADHRNDPASGRGGTQYWLPGDTYQSPPRVMTDLGPLPDGASTTAPAMTVGEAQAVKMSEFDRAMADIDAELIRSTTDLVAAMLTPAMLAADDDGTISLSDDELERSKAVFAKLRGIQLHNRALRAKVQAAETVEDVQAIEPVKVDRAGLEEVTL